MRAPRIGRTRRVGVLLLGVVMAVVAVGCSAPDEKSGDAAPVIVNLPDGRSVTVPDVPDRIVTIGGQWTDVALSFGVTPVGYYDATAQQTESLPPWYGDKLAKVAVVNPSDADVNLGAAQSALPQNGAAAPAAVVPSSSAATAAATPVAEDVPASDGGAGSGTAPIATAPAAGGTAAPAEPTVAPAPATQAAAPQALSPGQLNTKIRLIMNTGASRAARADELEAGARALGPVDAVANVLRVSGAGFTYQMIAPVTVSGNSMTATLQMSLVGQGSRTRALTWVWTGDKWKLSDRSTCDVAGLALVPCSL